MARTSNRRGGGSRRATRSRSSSSRGNGGGSDVVMLLKKDHADVKKLFKQFEQTEDDGEKERIARQICQMLCPLPAPSGMVWRYPGVPAILVTYGTANDLFFSGHTAIAVYGAATLAGHWGTSGLVLGLAIALFEAITVLVLRAHYTMDVFTGIVCALWVYTLSGKLAPHVDALIRQSVG